MPRPLLSVITDPVPYGIYFPLEFIKNILRKVKRIFKPIPFYMRSHYRGHPAVTRSLVEGLIKIGANANYNPKSYTQIGETVVVLSGIAALKQAIQLKRKGYIKKLLAGPNILELPSEFNGLISKEEVDLCITPCEWTNKRYLEDCPLLNGRLISWPAGVNTEFWKPDLSKKQNIVLIYEKQRKGPVGPVGPYKKWIESLGYKVKVIKCGEYSHGEFLNLLQRSSLMVGFVVDESQGLAWAEAWSTNVPTIIWRNTYNNYEKKPYICSTAPYLTKDTGLFFDDFENFKIVFSEWRSMRSEFQPRQWVLKHMSDEVCADFFCKIAGINLV